MNRLEVTVTSRLRRFFRLLESRSHTHRSQVRLLRNIHRGKSLIAAEFDPKPLGILSAFVFLKPTTNPPGQRPKRQGHRDDRCIPSHPLPRLEAIKMNRNKNPSIASRKKYQKGVGWADQPLQSGSNTRQIQFSEQRSTVQQILSSPRGAWLQPSQSESSRSGPAFQPVNNMFAPKTTAPAPGGLTISTASTPLL